jgi:hypothetical protein
MTTMDPSERLLHLIDHPPRDADAPRDPAFTAAVMERVQRQRRADAARPDPWPWLLVGAVLVAVGWFMPGAALTDDGIGDLAERLSPGLLLEVVAGAVAAGALLLAGRKWVV